MFFVFSPSTIANLLQCDVMMHLMQTILDRALDLKRKSFQENHLQKVCIGFKFEALFFNFYLLTLQILFLIGYGLQEEESNNYPFLTFYQLAQRHKLLPKLEELSRSPRVCFKIYVLICSFHTSFLSLRCVYHICIYISANLIGWSSSRFHFMDH